MRAKVASRIQLAEIAAVVAKDYENKAKKSKDTSDMRRFYRLSVEFTQTANSHRLLGQICGDRVAVL